VDRLFLHHPRLRRGLAKRNPVMGMIYENALCGSRGCRLQWWHFRRSRGAPFYQFLDEQEWRDWCRDILSHTRGPTITGGRNPSISARVSGWAIQERQLSRRIVSYAHHQAFWECRGSRACQAHPSTGLGRGLKEIRLLKHEDHRIGPFVSNIDCQGHVNVDRYRPA
jgi:hypothetical protein